MKNQELFAVSSDIGTMPSDERGTPAALRRLAESLCRHASLDRVDLICVPLTDGQNVLAPNSRLITGTSPQQLALSYRTVGELHFFGASEAHRAPTDATYELIKGPLQSSDGSLSANGRCLLARLRIGPFFCWTRMFGASKFDDSNQVLTWKTSLPQLIRIVMTDHTAPDAATITERQQLFYESLLGYVPHDPTADFMHICEAWQRVSNADWTWLWLYHSESDTFELTACCTRKGTEESERDVCPDEPLAPAGSNTTAAYCCRTQKAEFVDKIDSWQRTLENKEYRVRTAKPLGKLGCVGFDCIPLLLPGAEAANAQNLRAAGVVSLHWRELGLRIEHREDVLSNMGRLTALAIRNLRMTEQRSILVKLNVMASRVVDQPKTSPRDLRAKYLQELIELIQQHLHVSKVSIFFRKPFGNAVECLASTGLCDSTGTTVPSKALSKAVYRGYEGLTGSCFGSAEWMIIPRPRADRRYMGKFLEVRDVLPDDNAQDPLCLMPIPLPSEAKESKRQCLGVIRCVEHRSPIWSDRFVHFETNELQTLGFIAQQVGPVLHTLDQRIGREQLVRIVKHDLDTPLQLILSTIDGIKRNLGLELPIGEYDIANIQTCTRLAHNLAKQLDLEPGTIEPLEQAPTNLKGAIVARLCAMLRRYARLQNELSIQYDGFFPRLNIDREQIERVIFNILLNAIKYGEEGSKVRVVGGRTGTYGHFIDVTNERGIGVDEEEKDLIWEPGYRSPRAVHAAQGLGLGLVIARNIMRAHGGDLLLTSLKDPTTFRLLFPSSLNVAK